MTTIQLNTFILAPVERCFDLSRSIDLHKSSMYQSNEKAIAGRQTGLIELDESVTWEATYFFVKQHLSNMITEMERPDYFVDEMVAGAFKSLWHKHSFQSRKDFTLMIDEFKYEVPYGILGKAFNYMILNNYMIKLLKSRNEQIKKIAESKEWTNYLTVL